MLTETVRWIGFSLGLFLVVTTWHSIINTIILPRTITSNLTFLMWTAVHGAFHAAAGRRPRHEDKDRILALLGPVSLLVMLAGWMLLFVLGFALLLWPLIGEGFRAALAVSGSSFMTLGVAPAPPGLPTLLEYAAAATGMIVVALQIGYLPTIYGAYNRRETLILALRGRAGSPAWGPQVLANHQQYHMMPTMPAFFAAWETWAADITESHASYPWLMVFRSPEPDRSWVLSLLAVLDAAALYLALAPTLAPPETRPCLRAGLMALRTLARASGPPQRFHGAIEGMLPEGTPIQLTFEEFVHGVHVLQGTGFPTERTPDEAWEQFCFWRAQYEEAAYTLIEFIVIPPTPWTRRHDERQNV